MKLQQIRCFDAVVRTGSFRAASKQLYLTQPVVSLHVAKLEEQLGIKLLHRTARGSEITEAGNRLLPYLRAILEAEDVVVQRAEAERCWGQHTVRLWAMSTAHDVLIDQVSDRLKSEAPDLRLEVTMAKSASIINALADGSCDIGMVGHFGPICQTEDLTVLPVMVGHPAVVAPRDHPILHAEALTRKQFARSPLVGWKEGHTMHRIFHDYLSDAHSRVVATATSVEQMHSLIRADQGIGLGFDLDFWNETDEGTPLGFRYPDDLTLACNFCAITRTANREKRTWHVLRTLQDEALVRKEQLQSNVEAHKVAAPAAL